MHFLAVLGLAVCAASGCTDEKPDQPGDETRAVMREIFNGVRVALPASTDSEKFSDPEKRPQISAALEILANNAELLERHVQDRDSQMQFLARSVARDALEVRRSYAEGRYERSAYMLRQITENCVLCHTRLPDLDDSPVAAGFVDSEAMKSLPLEPRATLEIATRRFNEALADLEVLLLDPATHPAMMLGPLTDYLVVSIRVKRDFERPQALLEQFGQRKDLWPSLRQDVAQWVDAIPMLQRHAEAPPSVAAARTIVENAEANDRHGDGQAELLDLVVASGILERFIDEHSTRDESLGEAFFLLGTLEARIGRNYWVTPAPFLLEESIRVAPGADFASRAMEVLERELHAAYEGSDTEQLPEEDARRLLELRALIDAAP